ncbi:hypothetical protein OG818_15380 [Streptomyces virginiae]|uniref:hypothetical protein n=1 Tax=Streptomyces TaxID=1883 RepID=UPI00207A814D|nr:MULTISPECIES: hypothetical protein [Streptomyces]MCM9083073.1 hypothetical protein [Streptomyces spororaveus]MCX4717181.1 hypothetical protein [Streptomyces virginiae]
MPDVNVLAWFRRNVTEFRMAVAAVGIGFVFTVAAVVLYALPARGFPELAIGLSFLTTGLVMLGSGSLKR